MDSYASGKPSPAESLLSRRKKAIVARSMAEIERQLDRWLNNDELKPLKRRRGADDGDSVSGQQKRARRDHLRFACPFAKHDPAKYKNVKTCCGPGWIELHRVKEHVYRRHSLTNACNRCFELFEDTKALKEHQRSKDICEVSDKTPTDTITDEQEKQLRARAKANSSPVEKWQEMYRIIFPGAKARPSPYYDANEDVAATPAATELSRFKDVEECKAYVRKEFLSHVKPIIEHQVEHGLRQLENQVNKAANDLFHELSNKITRTWMFQAEQQAFLQQAAEPTPEPEPEDEKALALPGMITDMNEFIGTFNDDPMFSFLLPDVSLNFDLYMKPGDGAGVVVQEGCEASIGYDSAYFTSESRDGDSLGSGGGYY
ncbi:hypothetical protein OQA88_2088 [Cercophora sp. LCS_1]